MSNVKRFEVEIRDGKPFYKEHPEGCSVSYADYEKLLAERNKFRSMYKVSLETLVATSNSLVKLVNVFGKGRYDSETEMVRDNARFAREQLVELQKEESSG